MQVKEISMFQSGQNLAKSVSETDKNSDIIKIIQKRNSSIGSRPGFFKNYHAHCIPNITCIFSFSILTLILNLFLITKSTSAVELTFELPDKEESCFYEILEKADKIFFEFEVASGGNLDVDYTILDPAKNVLFQEQKTSFEEHVINVKATEIGEYSFCFSNKFSSFTHKVVYINIQVGEEDDETILFPDKGAVEHVYTKSEMSTVKIYEKLKMVVDYQTHHRLKESYERKFTEGLRDRVQLWSLLQFSIMVAVSILQVLIVRSFFSGVRSRIRRGP